MKEGMKKAYESPNSYYKDGNKLYIAGTKDMTDVMDWGKIVTGNFKDSKIYKNIKPVFENDKDIDKSFGRLCVFHGQMGMFVRALSYMMSHGSDGLRQVSEDAVLNANYIKSSLEDILTPAYEGYCMHEVLFNDDFLSGTGVETIDFAKALID